MLLILTCSRDASTDMVTARLSDIPIFRFDVDRWRDYAWKIDATGFELRHGDYVLNSRDLRTVYIRKPIHDGPIDVPAGGSLEHWCREEIDNMLRSLHDYCHAAGKVALVHPGHGRWDKVRQMWVAARYFKVPEWRMVKGAGWESSSAPQVVKANTGTLLGDGSFMTVREVDPARLAPDFPWFLQDKVPATHDVTVAYVQGELFAYELSRAEFSGVDCRAPTAQRQLSWPPCILTATHESAIRAFMAETGHSFGRLDFLRDGDTLWFLELNPNGMWAWLDLAGDNGLLNAVVRSLREHYDSATAGLGWSPAR